MAHVYEVARRTKHSIDTWAHVVETIEITPCGDNAALTLLSKEGIEAIYAPGEWTACLRDS